REGVREGGEAAAGGRVDGECDGGAEELGGGFGVEEGEAGPATAAGGCAGADAAGADLGAGVELEAGAAELVGADRGAGQGVAVEIGRASGRERVLHGVVWAWVEGKWDGRAGQGPEAVGQAGVGLCGEPGDATAEVELVA